MTEQTEQPAKKKSFKSTLNLPKTTFSMKANLIQNEPASVKRWNKQNLYQQLRDRQHPKGPFVFHDGPPYANGSIHLGHLLNKVLKDIVVRSKSMDGFDVPYVPGWDCHGLPIEHKVMQERQAKQKDTPADTAAPTGPLDEEARAKEAMSVRKDCKKYASKFVKLQSGQMQRLLTLADYDNPYLTMVPAYEAAVLEVFSSLVEKQLVYRQKKPVHWSIDNQTALADAELEYYDREDTSVFVEFQVQDASKLPASLKTPAGNDVSLMIWTTTPWTLPANLAVAVLAKAEYSLFKYETSDDDASDKQTRHVIIAEELHKKVFAHIGKENGSGYTRLGSCAGSALEDAAITYNHPFIDRTGPVVSADYVTLEDGTGMVHTAPGHGVEDYQTGLRIGLNIYCPVLDDGTFDNTAPDWLQGKSVWQGNDSVCEKLTASGNMFHQYKFMHSYPHDWRSKTPVIFRATEQWFVDVNKAFDIPSEPSKSNQSSMKQRALDATETGVKFYPEWGRNRMRGMLDTRPDWCLSRQRSWGLPIPAFFGPNNSVETSEVLLTKASVQAVADLVREKGSDSWFYMTARDLLSKYDVASDADAPDWIKAALADDSIEIKKAGDIFDVWFESGSSWNAVIRERDMARPDDAPAVTDLYLEGSDQHRGWFQLSLLPCLAATGKPPFESVLTHGFMVKPDGKKLSKSEGHTIESLFDHHGADVLRWWVSSLNTDNDIKVDESFFKHAGDEYRKVRNTLRFLMGNLADFDNAKDRCNLTEDDAASIDAWAIGKLTELIETVSQGFASYQFRKTHEEIFNFCNDTMSSVYLAATKDRLYCDKVDSPRRRRTQTVMFDICHALIRMIAPVLTHTADEAWAALHERKVDQGTSVHVELFPQVTPVAVNDDWPKVIEARDSWLKQIEESRQAMNIDNPMDIGLEVPSQDWLPQFNTTDLADLCNISRFTLVDGDETSEAKVIDLSDQPRCERSWKRDGTVTKVGEGDDAALLSTRDAEAMGM